ncbi:unnamed protein product [Clavelina lepadiformis]|uniref:Uncharacterized protein n=1 Tax=Clavelina lepadiformis TaxID=159417 RepID=A0ABP0FYI4_CLALP
MAQENWSNLVKKLGISDSNLAQLLIDSYQNKKDDFLDHSDSGSSLEEHGSSVLSKLNIQRLSNSPYCDVILTVQNTDKQLLAHSSVLAATLGKSFEDKLTSAPRNYNSPNRRHFCNENITDQADVFAALFETPAGNSSSCNLSDVAVKTCTHITVPKGFENILSFCYVGHFLPFDSESKVNMQETLQVIEEIVDDKDVKEKMMRQLGEVDLVSESLDNEYELFSNQPTIIEVSDRFAEKVPASKSHRNMDKVKNNEYQNDKVADDDDFWYYNDDDDIFSDNSDIDCKLAVPSFNFDGKTTTCANGMKETSIPPTKESGVPQYEKHSNVCDQCDESFSNTEELTQHKVDEHGVSKKRKRGRPRGSKSKKKFQEKSKIIHINIDEDDEDFLEQGSRSSGKTRSRFNRSYRKSIGKCCGENFYNKFRFGVHLFEKHCDVIVECVVCTNNISLNQLRSHFKTEHGWIDFSDNHSTIDAVSDNRNNELAKTGIGQESANQGTQSLETDLVLNSLLGSNEGSANSCLGGTITCRSCCQTFSVLNYIEHLERQVCSVDDIPSQSVALHRVSRCLLFQCKICKGSRKDPEKPIKLYLLVKRHVDRYHLNNSCGDEKETCNLCGRSVLKYYFDKHRNYHLYGSKESSTSSQKVPCDICARLVTKKRISVHRRTHFDSFPCPHPGCPRVFNRKENLKVHERIHTGEKPYVCDICGKGFRQYVELRLHNRKHEKDRLQRSVLPQQTILVPLDKCVLPRWDFGNTSGLFS